MAATIVRSWRGLLRGRMIASIRYLNGCLAYNTKHPTAALFTSAEVTEITAAVLILEAKLAATRPR